MAAAWVTHFLNAAYYRRAVDERFSTEETSRRTLSRDALERGARAQTAT